VRRADRLFRIVQILRTGRLVTARRLAERLEVAERTIYRDIRELSLSGVPIEGEAGVGYLLRSGFDIPPLMFTRGEIEALVAGARMVSTWGGEGLSASALAALEKITAAVPETLRRDAERTRLYALDFRARGSVLAMDRVRRPSTAGACSGFSMCARTARNRAVMCVRLRSTFGGQHGRSRRGASCAATFATFASIA